MIIDKYKKEEQEFAYEMDKQEDIKTNVDAEITLIEGKRRKIIEKANEKDKDKGKILESIDDLEKQLVKLQEFESEA